MNNETPTLPTNCVSPTECLESKNIDGTEISDIHIDTNDLSNESILNQKAFEYSDQQDKSIKVSKNLEMSTGTIQKGIVAKFIPITI